MSKILSMVVSFLATIFIARNLGPTNFGQLSYAVSFIGIFSFIASLGIENVLYRDLIKYPEQRNKYLGSAFTIKIVAGIVTALITIILAIFYTKDDVSKLLIYILSGTFIFNSFQIINYEFQAKIKSKYPAIIAFIITIILNILKIGLICYSKGVIYLSLVLLLESILYAAFYWFAYEQKLSGKVSDWQFDMGVAKNLLHDSWPLIFTSAFVLVYSRIDQILIKAFIDAHAVGIYDAAVKIAEVWYFIPGIIVTSLFPAIINAKKISEGLYYARIKKLALGLVTLSIVIALPVTLLSSFIISIIYGSAYSNGVIILQIYVWACTSMFLGLLIDNYLITENYRKILLFRSFVPMILNVILNLIWIPKYGITGSAYATLISYSFGPLVLLLFTDTRQKIFMYLRK